MTNSENSSGNIDKLFSRLSANLEAPAIYWRGTELRYGEFIKLIDSWSARLDADNIGAGDVCAFYGDFTPGTCAIMFALMQRRAVMVPLTGDVDVEMPELLAMAGVNALYRFDDNDVGTLEHQPERARPPLIEKFNESGHPGLVVFTSGSTGKPKGILQDVEHVARKFVRKRKGWRTILFLLMDHFGGFNTFLSSFAYGGMAVCPSGRDPENMARTIQDAGVTLLPTTPTFLNFLIFSKQYAVHDLSSVELVSYGTEPMPETTLRQLGEIFPRAKFKQTYGLSELGVLRSESESDGSLWLKIGGSGFETKIVDDLLWIRSEANMVGYLNAPNPFDESGWMCTGDIVEQKGDYIRFLGRSTEVINTGGKKVFPLEVENVLMQLPNVLNAVVEARPHPIMGQIIQARVSLNEPEDLLQMSERLRTACNKRLARYKVPVRFVEVDDDTLRSARFKKVRAEAS
jgi:long-chain acyl-CoA synthetase